MSRSKPRGPALPFEVQVLARNSDRVSIESKITVFDGWNEERATGYGSLKRQLEPGLYTIRIERGSAFEEKEIRHTSKTEQKLTEPLFDSAAPSFDTSAAHEYYSYTAAEWSNKDTGKAAQLFKAGPNAPRLFIFVRAVDASGGKKYLPKGLMLLRGEHELVTAFDESVVVENRDQGWLAFSAPAQSGWYQLGHEGEVERRMPLHVFPEWDSQLFVPFVDQARLEGASFFLARRDKGFDPESRLNGVIDAAFKGLANGLNLLPPELQRDALYGKFENPMPGLIGAYSLMNDPGAEPHFIDLVLKNLEKLLPGSADVMALRVMAAQKLGRPIPKKSFDVPPMVRLGLEAVIRASAQLPEITPEDGLIEQITPLLIASSVWSIWEKPATILTAQSTISETFDPGFRTATKDGVSPQSVDGSFGSQYREPLRPAVIEEPDWIMNLVIDEAARTSRRDSWLNLSKLAVEVGLPVRTLQQAAVRAGVATKKEATWLAVPADDEEQGGPAIPAE